MPTSTTTHLSITITIESPLTATFHPADGPFLAPIAAGTVFGTVSTSDPAFHGTMTVTSPDLFAMNGADLVAAREIPDTGESQSFTVEIDISE